MKNRNAVIIISLCLGFIAIPTAYSQSQFIWLARTSLRTQVEALRIENEQLRADVDALTAKLEAIRQAVAWLTAIDLDRQQMLLNADFPNGRLLDDVVGGTVPWTDALQADQVTKTATAQTLYDGVKDP